MWNFLKKLKDTDNSGKKKKDKKKITRRERMLIGILFLLTVILSLIFYLKTEVVYWYKNWSQPEVYHIE